MTGPVPLTANQERLWRFIASCERSPTYAEMRDNIGFRGYAGIQRALNRLEELGLIKRVKHRKRNIQLVQGPDGQKTVTFRSLSDWTIEQLRAELDRREASDEPRPSRNMFTDARIGSAKLLKRLEEAGLRP